ncbi:MAG: hypothetical protein IKX16_02375 [Clostridia bacterium]|nr:hypothetical protein [Clostridia bacterium]
MKKRGLLSWVLEFAGRKRAYFGGSVVLAMLGVAASFVPYLIIARIVEQFSFRCSCGKEKSTE